MALRLACGWEKIADLLAEPNVADLIRDYWEELSPVKEVAALDPDWPQMIALENVGRFRVWAARVEGTLAGFIAFHVFTHLNYQKTLFAIDGGHFLNPAFRGKGRIGYRMWSSCEAALRELGVQIVMAHDNAAHPLLPFFLALDYEPRSTIFWKVL